MAKQQDDQRVDSSLSPTQQPANEPPPVDPNPGILPGRQRRPPDHEPVYPANFVGPLRQFVSSSIDESEARRALDALDEQEQRIVTNALAWEGLAGAITTSKVFALALTTMEFSSDDHAAINIVCDALAAHIQRLVDGIPLGCRRLPEKDHADGEVVYMALQLVGESCQDGVGKEAASEVPSEQHQQSRSDGDDWLSETISQVRQCSADELTTFVAAVEERRRTLSSKHESSHIADDGSDDQRRRNSANVLQSLLRHSVFAPSELAALQVAIAERLRDLAYGQVSSRGERVVMLPDGRYIEDLRCREMLTVLQDLGMSVNSIAKSLGRNQSHLSQVANGVRENPIESLLLEVRGLMRKKIQQHSP